MSSLPFNTDCTIYNDHGTGADRVTVKHTIPRVWWEEAQGVSFIEKGVTIDDSLTIMLTAREGYKSPQEWRQLSKEEVLTGAFYTLQEGDCVIDGIQTDAPDTFQSTQAVGAYFKGLSRTITRVSPHRLPGGKIHHYTVKC